MRVPGRIASDGSVDVTKPLARFIRGVPGHSRIVFARRGVYRIEGTIIVKDRLNLVFSGRGATLKATTWRGTSRTRSQLRFIDGGNLIVRNLTVKGANPYAGADDDRAYNPRYEAQHAFDILGVQGMLLDHVRAHDTWGDFVYIGNNGPTPSRAITVRNSTFARNGRQGICVCAGEDILIANNRLSDMRRAVFDIEPSAESWQVHRVSIIRNVTGKHRLLWLANAGMGGENVSDIYVAHNVAVFGSVVVKNYSLTSARRNYTIEYNEFTISGSPGAPFGFLAANGGPGIENVIIRNNTTTFPYAMTAVSLLNAHTVQVYDNVFDGATTVISADPLSTDYSEWGNTT